MIWVDRIQYLTQDHDIAVKIAMRAASVIINRIDAFSKTNSYNLGVRHRTHTFPDSGWNMDNIYLGMKAYSPLTVSEDTQISTYDSMGGRRFYIDTKGKIKLVSVAHRWSQATYREPFKGEYVTYCLGSPEDRTIRKLRLKIVF